ncbi:BsuBI/PstI family type II restriction endonuclease [Streptomyces antarcticus]|uniref:BsuBI/PstI family type II restriction endonuclease n=1 Tax=Streptomyces antarcticus TaxID=2996458 RepID=UPI0022AEF800|nr:BsuBI/PstI family type II restriction endonuclease [Streptomyces sp. H34-S5]MCZ4083271.1 BsuBI/PstI family type II restriction endonuclease [Streptomyces sp. H34-S5]
MTSTLQASIDNAGALLQAFGFDKVRCNSRSALTALALLGLEPGEPWDAATNPRLGVTEIMGVIAEKWGKTYAPNSRETFRKQTLHQFVDAGFAEHNSDAPEGRAVNSSKNNYRIAPAALSVVRLFGTRGFQDALDAWIAEAPTQQAAYKATRDMQMIPVTLPDGSVFRLSPGGQNPLIRDMVEEFCPRFARGGQLLYLGDAKDHRYDIRHDDAFARLGLTFDEHGKNPDLVVYDEKRGWLFLMEAVTSHGPIDFGRRQHLKKLFATDKAGLVFVNCFPDRATMRKWLADLAWETEAWVADAPDHLIHLNGSRFLGPYE